MLYELQLPIEFSGQKRSGRTVCGVNLQHVDNMFGDSFDGRRIERVVQNHIYIRSRESMVEDLPITFERTDAGCEFVENATHCPYVDFIVVHGGIPVGIH
jgi:hypothetical protein